MIIYAHLYGGPADVEERGADRVIDGRADGAVAEGVRGEDPQEAHDHQRRPQHVPHLAAPKLERRDALMIEARDTDDFTSGVWGVELRGWLEPDYGLRTLPHVSYLSLYQLL
jgi:hypothetical protein